MGFSARRGRPIPSGTVPVSVFVSAHVSCSTTDSGTLAIVSFSGDGSPSERERQKREKRDGDCEGEGEKWREKNRKLETMGRELDRDS